MPKPKWQLKQKWGRYRYRPHSHRRVDLTRRYFTPDVSLHLERCSYVVRRSRRCRIYAGSNGNLCRPPSLRADHPRLVKILVPRAVLAILRSQAQQHRVFPPAIRLPLCWHFTVSLAFAFAGLPLASLSAETWLPRRLLHDFVASSRQAIRRSATISAFDVMKMLNLRDSRKVIDMHLSTFDENTSGQGWTTQQLIAIDVKYCYAAYVSQVQRQIGNVFAAF